MSRFFQPFDWSSLTASLTALASHTPGDARPPSSARPPVTRWPSVQPDDEQEAVR